MLKPKLRSPPCPAFMKVLEIQTQVPCLHSSTLPTKPSRLLTLIFLTKPPFQAKTFNMASQHILSLKFDFLTRLSILIYVLTLSKTETCKINRIKIRDQYCNDWKSKKKQFKWNFSKMKNAYHDPMCLLYRKAKIFTYYLSFKILFTAYTQKTNIQQNTWYFNPTAFKYFYNP